MLTFRNHTIQFSESPLIHQLNLEINQGEIICILGRNGVGKSSLLNSVFTQNKTIFFQSKSLFEYSKKDLAKTISFLKPGSRPAFNISISDYLELGRIPYQDILNLKNDKVDLEPYLSLMGVEKFKNKSTEFLSDGEFQKVQILRALVQDTPIILLDEPTSFLDFPSKIELYKHLQFIAKKFNKTIIFTTHDIDLAWKFTHKTLFLKGNGSFSIESSKTITKDVLNAYFETDFFCFDDVNNYVIK